MDLRDVLKAVADIEKGVAITDPQQLAVAEAYAFPPSANTPLPLPCWLNYWSFDGETRRPNNQREVKYTVRAQFLVARGDVDTQGWSEVAAAFHQEILAAFDKAVLLKQTPALQDFHGVQGLFLPAELKWNDLPYLGLEYEVDVTINEIAAFGP